MDSTSTSSTTTNAGSGSGNSSNNSSGPQIRVGIGGWTFEPWRDNFYPGGCPQQELRYASRQLTAIEVNGTYYSTFKPADLRQMAGEDARGLRVLAQGQPVRNQPPRAGEAGESIARFIDSGISRTGNKLGPIVWQFMPTKKSDPGDFEASSAAAGRGRRPRLRHVLDVRHGVSSHRSSSRWRAVRLRGGAHRLRQVPVLRELTRTLSTCG